jgi:hypothetical protein
MSDIFGASDFDDFTGFGEGNALNTGGLTLPALQGSGAGSFVAGNPLGFGTSGATDGITGSNPATGSSASTFAGSPADLTGISSAGAVGTQGTVGTIGAGAPVDITDLSGLDSSVSGAGKAVQTGAGTIGSDTTTAASGLTGTLASAVNSLETYTSSTFVVVALAVMGIIFIAFGLGLFGKHPVQKVVNNTRSLPPIIPV